MNVLQMNSEIKSEFDRYISYISKINGVIRIYLFGSYAFGNPTEYSDIDLFIILRDGIDKLKVIQDIDFGLCDRNISLDIIADTDTEFKKLSASGRATLQNEVFNKGILVYEY